MSGTRKEIIMLKFDLGVRVAQECPTGSTHSIKGSFADSEFETPSATDLFCYNQTTGTGAFFVTVKNSQFDRGISLRDQPHKIGENHTFSRRWTHIVYIPIFFIARSLPHIGQLILFYDAASGVAEVYETNGNGNLILKKQYSGWRTSWTQIVGGQFGNANLLFYDATNKVGEFHNIGPSGDIQFIEGWS
jgi:hypothetical protein